MTPTGADFCEDMMTTAMDSGVGMRNSSLRREFIITGDPILSGARTLGGVQGAASSKSVERRRPPPHP